MRYEDLPKGENVIGAYEFHYNTGPAVVIFENTNDPRKHKVQFITTAEPSQRYRYGTCCNYNAAFRMATEDEAGRLREAIAKHSKKPGRKKVENREPKINDTYQII